MNTISFIFVFLMMVIIVLSLGAGLFYFMRHRHQIDEKRIAQSLTIRVVLSLLLFALLIFAYLMGWLHPHGLQL